jgi:hypothetical protein
MGRRHLNGLVALLITLVPVLVLTGCTLPFGDDEAATTDPVAASSKNGRPCHGRGPASRSSSQVLSIYVRSEPSSIPLGIRPAP